MIAPGVSRRISERPALRIVSAPAKTRSAPASQCATSSRRTSIGRIAVLYSASRRSRSELAITENELRLIAALAIIGDSRRPNTG